MTDGIKVRIFSDEEKEQIVFLMERAGFTFHPCRPEESDIMTGLFFTISSDDETDYIKMWQEKNHIKEIRPRHVSVFSAYVTSSINCTVRGYRCRNWEQRSILNIFSFFKNEQGESLPVEAVKKFIEDYRSRNYNQPFYK